MQTAVNAAEDHFAVNGIH